jgi:hypothetical protein
MVEMCMGKQYGIDALWSKCKGSFVLLLLMPSLVKSKINDNAAFPNLEKVA